MISRRTSLLISSLAVVAGLVIPFIGLGTYLYWTDELYQALSVRHYADAPIGMLSFYIGSLWARLFGDSLYSLRVLMVICYQFSIALSCLFLYRRTGQTFLSSLLFMMLCAAARFVSLPLYGWDAGAYPFMTAFAIGVLCYMDRPDLRRIALVGVLTALMALSRMSTLAALPFILAVIIYAVRKSGASDTQVRKIVIQSAFGLAVFGLTAFAVILLMTSGDPTAYIRAWNPDNIVNRHFDPGYLIWRLQECSRNVFTAYYPMTLCFAGACVAVAARRRRVMTFAAVSAVCAFLALNYIKFYLNSEVQPFGLLQSFYLLILFLPWLYNLTHSRRVSADVPHLLVVTCCAMLATVGSDGFVERPMVLSIIPLLCIFTDRRLLRLIRVYTAVALVSVLIIAAYTVHLNMKTATEDLSVYDHLQGLKGDPKHPYIQKLKKINSRIDKIERDGARWAVVGTERYVFDYINHDTTSYSMHHFHYLDGPSEMEILGELCKSYDNIILLNGYTENSVAFLEANGFRLSESDEFYRLFSRRDL